MKLLEAIYRLIARPTSLDSLPYEELHQRFPNAKRAVWEEFVRRLRRLVFQAVQDNCRRKLPHASLEDLKEQTSQVFAEFYPEFGGGEGETVLLRFARVIRHILEDESFERIARRFYYHLPLYHVQDDQQRRFLAALFENGLATPPGKGFGEDIADRFQVPLEKALEVLRDGRKQLDEVINKEFTEEELRELTEDYLPDKEVS